MDELLAHLAEAVPNYVSVAAVVIVILEWIALTITDKIDHHKEGWVNFGSAAVTFLPMFAFHTLISMGVMFSVYEIRLFDLGLEWYVWVIGFVIADLLVYVFHLLSHKVRFMWCMHSVHHSPVEMKASVAFRGSFADFLLLPHTIMWLPLLGFNPFMVLIIDGIGMIFGVPQHLSDSYLPKTENRWLRMLFVTPSIHRIHHCKNDAYLDTNYARTFSIWDRLFKTNQYWVQGEEPVYGLTKEINSSNFIETQTDEFVSLWKDMKSAPSYIDKFKYLIKPPGWNHIDGGRTAQDIRREAKQDPPQSLDVSSHSAKDGKEISIPIEVL